MSKKQMIKTREQLLSKLADMMGNTPKLDEYLGDWSNDPMDQVQSRADMDMAVSFVNTDFETKRAIKKALARIESGDYGICEECEEEINPKRLDAIPWTTMCVSCREAHDEEVANLKKAA
jgi:DnaK suppressor protein